MSTYAGSSGPHLQLQASGLHQVMKNLPCCFLTVPRCPGLTWGGKNPAFIYPPTHPTLLLHRSTVKPWMRSQNLQLNTFLLLLNPH